MTNSESRLISIFESVFPDLPADRIQSATQSTVPNWDSVAAITLMNLIEEEFSLEMDFDDLADLTSFGKILAYIDRKLSSSAA